MYDSCCRGENTWSIKEELQQYDIDTLLVINPMMCDKFPIEPVILGNSKIAASVCFPRNIQIVIDGTSSITIEEEVSFGENVKIFAMNGSQITIKEKASICEGTFLSAENNSSISIGEKNVLAEKVNFSAKENSRITLEDNCGCASNTNICVRSNACCLIGTESFLGRMCIVALEENAEVRFLGKNRVSDNGILECSSNAKIEVGKGTTFNSNLYMSVSHSMIDIGKDCMFSYYVKMNSGSHKIKDRMSGNEVTNYTPVRIGDHVWIGMGAILLPGCNMENGSIAGAGAIVNKRIPANAVCVGSPAHVVRENIEWER